MSKDINKISNKIVTEEEELIPGDGEYLWQTVSSKDEALEKLKHILPKGEYVWYSTYRANKGRKGMKRNILPTEVGDHTAPCHVKEYYIDTVMYPEWANIMVSQHWKLIPLSEWNKLPKDKGSHSPVIVEI